MSMIDVESRLKKLIVIFETIKPDIICLQEVNKYVYDKLKQYFEDVNSPLYGMYKNSGYDVNSSYSVVVFFRLKSERVALKKISFNITQMNRNITWLQFRNFDLITLHLESMKPNKLVRQEQLKQVLSLNLGPRVIICGDFNFIEDDEDQILINNGYIDYSPEEPSYNYLKNKNILGPWISKLDRIFTKGVDVDESILVEDDEISDHFGIAFRF